MISDRDFLNQRELDVMHILWNLESPLTAAEIVEENQELTVITVQKVLQKLLEKGYIEIRDSVISGKRPARRFAAKISPEDFFSGQINTFLPEKKKPAFCRGFMAALFNNSEADEDMLAELEDFIAKKRKEAEEG